jgi:hypothetical protein
MEDRPGNLGKTYQASVVPCLPPLSAHFSHQQVPDKSSHKLPSWLSNPAKILPLCLTFHTPKQAGYSLRKTPILEHLFQLIKNIIFSNGWVIQKLSPFLVPCAMQLLVNCLVHFHNIIIYIKPESFYKLFTELFG